MRLVLKARIDRRLCECVFACVRMNGCWTSSISARIRRTSVGDIISSCLFLYVIGVGIEHSSMYTIPVALHLSFGVQLESFAFCRKNNGLVHNTECSQR